MQLRCFCSSHRSRHKKSTGRLRIKYGSFGPRGAYGDLGISGTISGNPMKTPVLLLGFEASHRNSNRRFLLGLMPHTLPSLRTLIVRTPESNTRERVWRA